LLVDLLARTDFMEKAGTGIKRVTNACIKNGNKVNFDFSDSFWVTIKSNDTDKVTDKVTDRVTNKVTDNQQTIMRAIKANNKVTTSELAQIVGISQRKIKENISKLKEYGFLERIGSPKGGYWEIINE